MRSLTFLHVPLLCGLLFLNTVTAQMPFNPTTILQNGARLYVYRPSPGSSSQFELGSIDLSSKVIASELQLTTLLPTLPFLDTKTRRAFTPILDNGGNMTVYTGDCAMGVGGAEVWTFTPQTSAKSGNGTWEQESLSYNKQDMHFSAIGPNYLNGGMAFSSLVKGGAKDTGAYFFGGMCPSPDGSSDWQSAANYSNLMVTLQPSKDTTKPFGYQIGVSPSRGPPIAEAGFTLTGLSPSFSNKSDGTQTQQQNFVLVGGHTSNAFINMSQVALFSLPEQGWTFLPVSQPDTQRTDLAIHTDVNEIEPRSGHTAVLTQDGQRIVLFGGWIGDVDTPANPQLAILNVGQGFGGQGNWEWTVPATSGPGLTKNSGIYGHGAVMLPGGVMMVMGGYSISAPSSRWRRAGKTAYTKTLFFNVTSNTWISEYSPPPQTATSAPAQIGPLAKTSQKVGLGAGLGIGMAAVLGLMVFYIWYTRRLKKQRDFREKQLRDLAMGAHRYNIECLTPGVDGRGGHIDAVEYFDDANDFYPTADCQQNQGWRRSNGHDAERTGLLVEIPSPTRGLRRSLGSRASHHLNGRGGASVRGSGHIHPIDELEEEEQVHEKEQTVDKTPLASQPEMLERSANRGVSIFDSAPVLDPFTNSHRASGLSTKQRKSVTHSAPASPTCDGAEEGNHDWEIVHPGRSSPTSNGRVSPTKSDRTESNLSERSMRSNLSSNSTNGSVRRSVSVRSTAILNNAFHVNPFKTPEGSPTRDIHHRHSGGGGGGGGWQSPTDPRTQSFTSIRSSGRPNVVNADTDSFMTARTSFMQLQAEGEALLGGNPERERARPDTASTSNGSSTHTYRDTEGSGTMSRAGTITAMTSVTDASTRPRERRKSWLGSVRRALSRSTTAMDTRTRSLTTSTPQLESYTDNPPSPTAPASKRKSFPVSSPPRRAASDAGFWTGKRGKQDWLDDELDPNDPRARWRRTSGDNWGAPEDVAFAEKERKRAEWRQRGNLISLGDEDHIHLPSPHPSNLPPGDFLSGRGGEDERPSTPADEEDWDVEAAVERRVVQVMFTVPKTRLRVVNADVDGSSILSLPREDRDKDKSDGKGDASMSPSNSPSRVKDLVGRFEQQGPPRMSPRPSPSPSVRSFKVRGKGKEREGATDTEAEER
ncbi:uncharacterized protein BDR25DRAFT_305759 [Lindgomyces ingoldianus]|uniref:Uncharacterized protein n=1 Tax=Lindgomyces ingoldianus TaxID=673940 RepID=A0ACB6QJ51_9PLEO|nr:uncharacterized protein BDR25DRAFT_305759 [Lindgomyces ingoldianus]KAF2466892.1 hypothetical protein BDR25DRAFT_305759 [Lindgomyces ingoldianus]